MAQDSSHLVWLDLEMTGLDPDTDVIIEIATVITDKHLNILAQGPVLGEAPPEKKGQMGIWRQEERHLHAAAVLDEDRAPCAGEREG
ncbi:MAG: exonuclease domain-containing protein, partial [Gammaproteobacteria bacterium]